MTDKKTADLFVTLVVYHLPKKSGNFGWNVNGKANFRFRNGTFPKKTGFFESKSKIPKRKMCVAFIVFYQFKVLRQ